jgi:phage terminase large subunit-like protein
LRKVEAMERLRGLEHDFAWCDELAKWRHAGEAWDNLQLGLRRGIAPRALVTTTPRRGEALKRLLGEDGVVVTGRGSAANPHLPAGWVAAQAARLGGGVLRRQELEGELIDEVAGALWTRELIEACRVESLSAADAAGPLSPLAFGESPSPARGEGWFTRVVIGVDPPAGDGVCGSWRRDWEPMDWLMCSATIARAD